MATCGSAKASDIVNGIANDIIRKIKLDLYQIWSFPILQTKILLGKSLAWDYSIEMF